MFDQPDPDKPVDVLLQDVRLGAVNALNMKSTSVAVLPFATLLVRLSRDANAAAADNTGALQGNMTAIQKEEKAIKRLTFALAFFTVILVVLAGVEVCAVIKRDTAAAGSEGWRPVAVSAPPSTPTAVALGTPEPNAR